MLSATNMITPVLMEFEKGGILLAIALKDGNGKYRKLTPEIRKMAADLIPGLNDDSIMEIPPGKIKELENASWLEIEEPAKEIINRGKRNRWEGYEITEF